MDNAPSRRVVLVTGLSGAGKTSILRALEDLGYQAIDNLPLALIKVTVERESRAVALGVDARTQDFATDALIRLMLELRRDPSLQPELVFATAAPEALRRRYTETRRRHPMACAGTVMGAVAAEEHLMSSVRQHADLLVDTSELSPSELRRMIGTLFRIDQDDQALKILLVSFAFSAGLPSEADMVFDARFLRNPHYHEELRALSGLDPTVAAYIGEDAEYCPFLDKVTDLLCLLLPRFVEEGKRYVTIAVGCTGGRHRSVHIVDCLYGRLAAAGWRVSSVHRELTRNHAASQGPTDGLLPTEIAGRSSARLFRPASPREA